jgi:cell division protein ZapE
MSKDVQKIYSNFVSNNFLTYDEGQEKLLKTINVTWKNIKRFKLFFNSKNFNGVYVYGSVGIGKTFLLNLFTQNINRGKKIHYNHFMINLHAHINNNKESNALEKYIKSLSQEYNLLFLDELHIFNIVDALLIKKIFTLFKKYRIFILISSNFKPSDLYKDGLQRDDFLPFINFVEKYFQIIYLQEIRDYRRQMLNQSKTYFSPINKNTIIEFNRLFDRFVDKDQIHIRKIKSKSRNIRFEKCTANVAFCSFKELCATNLAHEDYYNIAKTFKLLFISEIPFFNDSNSDQCRRFISLIDMLYDKRCSVVILADKPINKLCGIKNLDKEFQRTSSRLYEMTIIN